MQLHFLNSRARSFPSLSVRFRNFIFFSHFVEFRPASTRSVFRPVASVCSLLLGPSHPRSNPTNPTQPPKPDVGGGCLRGRLTTHGREGPPRRHATTQTVCSTVPLSGVGFAIVDRIIRSAVRKCEGKTWSFFGGEF